VRKIKNKVQNRPYQENVFGYINVKATIDKLEATKVSTKSKNLNAKINIMNGCGIFYKKNTIWEKTTRAIQRFESL